MADTVLNVVISVDTDGNALLLCPHCGAKNTIVEQDVGIRWNRLESIEVVDGQPGAILTWSTGDRGDFEGDFFFCEACQGKVEMPDDVDHNYD